MPFLTEKIVSPGIRVGFWVLSESLEELNEMVSALQINEMEASVPKLEKRKKERLGRMLLIEQMGFSEKISFSSTGKPIAESSHISFSHSGDLVAFVLAARPVGIDVQSPNPKLIKIKDKFCHPGDFNNSRQVDDLDYLTWLWTLKEAVFKIYGENVNFKDVRPSVPGRAVVYKNGIASEHEYITDSVNGITVTIATKHLRLQ